MLGWRRGVLIAQLAVKSRMICCSHSRQFLVKPFTCRSVRRQSVSTVVGSVDDKTVSCSYTDAEYSPVPWHSVVSASDAVAEKQISENLRVYEDFISHDEEKCIFDEVEPYLRRLKYEHDHWDDVSDLIFILIFLKIEVVPTRLLVKCGIAACGIRKIICGMKSVES